MPISTQTKNCQVDVFETDLSTELFQLIKLAIIEDLGADDTILTDAMVITKVGWYLSHVLEALCDDEHQSNEFHPELQMPALKFFCSIINKVSMLAIVHITFIDTGSILIVSTNNN